MRPLSARALRALACALVLSLCGPTACTTMETIDNSQLASGNAVRPGDSVRVRTTDKKVLRFTVTAVSASTITGERPASRAREPDSGYETSRSSPDSRREVVIPVTSIETRKVQTLDPEDPSDTTALFWQGFGTGYVVTAGGFCLIVLIAVAVHAAGIDLLAVFDRCTVPVSPAENVERTIRSDFDVRRFEHAP